MPDTTCHDCQHDVSRWLMRRVVFWDTFFRKRWNNFQILISIPTFQVSSRVFSFVFHTFDFVESTSARISEFKLVFISFIPRLSIPSQSESSKTKETNTIWHLNLDPGHWVMQRTWRPCVIQLTEAFSLTACPLPIQMKMQKHGWQWWRKTILSRVFTGLL